MLQEGGLYPGARALEVLQLFAAFYDDPDSPEAAPRAGGPCKMRAGASFGACRAGSNSDSRSRLALIGRPSLVFLDEPTAGMDPRARATTWTMIRELRDQDVTVVLTTHAMDEAEHLCDNIGIIDRGRLVACGSRPNLTSRAAADETTFSTVPGLDTPPWRSRCPSRLPACGRRVRATISSTRPPRRC